jgi:hypothetical protein
MKTIIITLISIILFSCGGSIERSESDKQKLDSIRNSEYEKIELKPKQYEKVVEVTFFNGQKDTLFVNTPWKQTFHLSDGGLFAEAGTLTTSYYGDATKRKTVAITVRSYRIIK